MEPPYVDGPDQQTPSLDESVINCLPQLRSIKGCFNHGASAWARTYRIDVELLDGRMQRYFMKVSVGHHGREALKGEFEGTSAIASITPDFVPTPLGWGTYKSSPETHFYLCKFHDLADELPSPGAFCAKLAELHRSHSSGKYGFHVVTYNGDLPQENSYVDTWEEFFANGLRHMFKLNIERGGLNEELQQLMPALFEKVIPRLLRPLETCGNSIKPSLVHGDLWCGNAAVDQETDQPLVFDPSSFWAHNEYELGNWRPERNKFSSSYFNAYHSHIPKAAPEEDYDDRNSLYALRFNLHAATLFPTVESFRESVIEEMKRLTDKYPDGYEGWIEQRKGDS